MRENNFKFFPNTQEAEKYAYSKDCTEQRITKFKEQYLVVDDIIDALEVIETYYKAGFEREKATAIANAQYILSQVNGFTQELIEKYEEG